MKHTFPAYQHQPKISFFKGLFMGLVHVAKTASYLVGAITAFFGMLQVLYVLGWCLYSVMPKNGPRTISILGSEINILADTPTPVTAWLFAIDSRPALICTGVLLLTAFALAVLMAIGIASLGGWRNSRVRLFSEWINR